VSSQRPRTRRPRVAALLLSLTAVAVALAALVTGWFLLAVPFTVVAAYGAWLGLSNEELFDAWGTASGDDAGRGPTGLSL
jgi:fatty acid desaturase